MHANAMDACIALRVELVRMALYAVDADVCLMLFRETGGKPRIEVGEDSGVTSVVASGIMFLEG